MTSPLPEAERRRWQPLRCGLVDLFYYDYQEFWFRDGRMLLRGNNGTGKSKVLALTLPFLLDGELTASRVEPDGDRGKKMEWNLLLGGRYDERLGYTWLEFGRRTEEGRREYFTIGCGMKAVTGRGIADRWFFTTSQRIGRDLFLIGRRTARADFLLFLHGITHLFPLSHLCLIVVFGRQAFPFSGILCDRLGRLNFLTFSLLVCVLVGHGGNSSVVSDIQRANLTPKGSPARKGCNCRASAKSGRQGIP